MHNAQRNFENAYQECLLGSQTINGGTLREARCLIKLTTPFSGVPPRVSMQERTSPLSGIAKLNNDNVLRGGTTIHR